MSEQQGELTSGEPDASHSSEAQDAAAQPMADVEFPKLVPEQGAAADADLLKRDAARTDAPKPDAAKPDPSKPGAPHMPGRVLIMSADDHGWNSRGHDAGSEMDSEPAQGLFGKRRLSALAAVVALAVLAGGLGGALATAGLSHFAGDGAASTGNAALEASVARIDTDILALKATVEHNSQLGTAQFNKTGDRLDKVEKAQVEPLAKLARLSEAVEKLRTAAIVPVAAAPAASKEVTGSIAPLANAPAAPPKVEVARLPTIEGWALRDIANGSALIESRQGMYEVYAGDAVPGLGRIEAIRRQDGHWVVVTAKGLIVAR